jgi:hypothetical protein
MVVKYSKRPEYMYNKNFHSKVLKNIPQLGFLVRKETFWQPWLARLQTFLELREEDVLMCDMYVIRKICGRGHTSN